VVGFAGSVRELGDTAFSLDAAACSGDAGGPLISDWTGEVVGVLSGTPVQADDKSASSVSGVAARVDVARGLLAQAFLMAHGVSAAELPAIACP
jgi:S1-C subfamily serine protease